MTFKELLCRLFSVEVVPDIPVGNTQDLSDEDYPVEDAYAYETDSDPAPVEVYVGKPIATIGRPSRSWSGTTYGMVTADNGRQLRIANRNPFRTRLTIALRSGDGSAVRLAPTQESLPGGYLLSNFGFTSTEVQLNTMAEVWMEIVTAGSTDPANNYVTVLEEMEDGS